MTNIINTIKSNKAVLFNLAKIALVIAIFTLIPVGTAKNKTFDSRISLNTSSASPLVLNDKKVEIVDGIANVDMATLNENPNPEMIKLYMKTIASEYGVDWKLVYAIGYHESGNYNSSLAQRNNNYFGRKAGSGGYASWATPEEGIRNQFAYLNDKYFARGLNTPAKINPVYAEDSSWQIKVQSVMNTL